MEEELKYWIENQVDTFHTWGDDWPYWDELYKAIEEMRPYIKKSRILVYDKEKFGTYRFSVLGWYDGTLKSILQPSIRSNFDWYFRSSWMYNNHKRIYDAIKNYIEPCVNWFLKGISKVDRRFSKFIPEKFKSWVVEKQFGVINKGFQEVALKYPQVVNELVSDVDCYKCIKPYGKYILDGEVIFNKYWNSNEI